MVRARETANRGKWTKWRLDDVPRDEIVKLGWKDGDELEAEARGDHLIVRRKK